MEKRVADIVVETLLELGINECFCVVGGGAMHLNNAFEISQAMNVTYCHHEQACAFAAEGYAKYSSKCAAVCVTSGPGSVNTLNGVYSAWVDSAPMIVIAGYPRLETTIEACGLNLRCRGVQEFDIITAVKGMTKYAALIKDANKIKKEIQYAYHVAMDGRRGPVWLTIPLDIQAAIVEEGKLEKEETFVSDVKQELDIDKIIAQVSNAKRPCILTGSAIRYTDAIDKFLRFIEKVEIPVVGGALVPDTLPEGYPLYYGPSGNIGPRAGNYILRNSDLILVLGNSLSTRQTGFNVEEFAPDSHFIMVDAERDEPFKPGLHIDNPIQIDINVFLDMMNEHIKEKIKAPDSWIQYCNAIYTFFDGFDDISCSTSERVPAKAFWKLFREYLPDKCAIALGNSNCVVGIYQYGTKTLGQRVITNSNAGSMGYDLPEALGIATTCNLPVYCITGDGSIMMNLQELATIAYKDFPIKIVIFSNEGYGAIRQTCKNYFHGIYTGCDKESGVGFPDFHKVSDAFGFHYFHCPNYGALEDTLKQFMAFKGRCIMVVEQRLDDSVQPRVVSKMSCDGKFETPGITELYPYLSDKQQAYVNALRQEG